MADVDRYSSNQPRYGGGGGRKRRYQDFDEGRDNRQYQRRRFDPPGTRLRKKLLSLRDGAFQPPEQDVGEIASLIIQYAHDDYVRDTFIDHIVSIALEQPAKTVYVAAIAEKVNEQKHDLVAELLTRLVETLEREVRRGRWIKVKLGLRLGACLQGVMVEGEGVLGVLEEMFQRVVDLQSSNPEETLGPELTKIILLTIPYLMATNAASAVRERVQELLTKTDVVASTTHILENLVDPYPSDDPDKKPMLCQSLLSLLQTQLQNEAAAGWPLTCIPRINLEEAKIEKQANGDTNGDSKDEAKGTTNGDADMGEESRKHSFPALKLPDVLNPGQRPPFPEIYYSVFADQGLESVPPTSNIASTIIRDAAVDTINALDYNRTVIGKLIVNFDECWAPDTFVKRGTPFDKLREVPDGKTTWKPEDMAIDAVFSQLFQLPSPVHKVAYYHSIIMEACKIAPQTIAPSLGRAIRFTFRNLPELDLELVQRFTDWFAHHVSNFEFRWKWTEWTPETAVSNLHSKKAFILAAIDKEIRLSFPKRIADSLPPDFAALIAKGQYNDQPDYKFADNSTPYASEGQQLLSVLKDKQSSDADIQAILDQVQSLASDQGADPDVASTDVLVTSICHIGSKSLSHILSAIEKNRERLLSIGPTSEAARRQIITSVTSYWQHHPGQAVNIVDKLLNYTIVTPSSVVQWALSDQLDSGAGLARHDILEMVWSTMGKVARRVADIAAARANPDIIASGNEENIKMIEDTLVRERANMRELFQAIDDVVSAVAQGSQDGMVEGMDDGEDRLELVKAWGARWSRTWRRRAAVEEARSGEEGVKVLEGVLKEVKAVEELVEEDEREEKRKREEARVKRDEERRKRFEGERERNGDHGGPVEDGRGRREGREAENDEVL